MSTLYRLLNMMIVHYPFVVESEMIISNILKNLLKNRHSIEIIPHLDNPYMSVLDNLEYSFEKRPRLRVVSYDLKPDRQARRSVRKAQSNGLTYNILAAEDLKPSIIRDFLRCAAESLKRRGRIIDVNEVLVDKWYNTLRSISEKDKGIFIAVYNKNGNLVGGAYVLMNEKYYFTI